ncbi:MAG: hypothetical protein MSA34_02380 [Firmicutes bacterium]|nr:hypothetical protein [Bacillota bacterium]MDY5585988.1 hypothetical protein [Eubacteriales bacterium]
MLDKRSEALLRIINKECSEGSYRVLEVDDLIRLMPKKFKVDFDTISQLMGYLKTGEYVSVKYSDNEVFCVSPLPRGRRIFEVEQEEKNSNKKSKLKKFFLLTFYLLLIFGVSLGAAYISKFF